MLRDAGIPVFSHQRDASWPLVIAGGPAVYSNPEPLADIIDAFAIGEAEALATPLLDALWEASQVDRSRALALLAGVPGMYVPAVSTAPVARVWQRDVAEAPATTQTLHSRHRIRRPGADRDRSRLLARLPLLPGRFRLSPAAPRERGGRAGRGPSGSCRTATRSAW